MKKGLLIAGSIFLAWYFYQGQQFSKYIKARITSLKFDAARSQNNLFTQLWFNVGLQISNPSQFATQLKGVSLGIFYKGMKVANVEQLGTLELKPNTENNITVPTSILTLNIFPNVNAAIQSIRKGEPINIQLKGVIATTSGNIEINENIKAI